MATVMHDIHPDRLSVTIEERGGAWLVQVNELPQFRGTGATVEEAAAAAIALASKAFTTLDASGDVRTHYAAAFALEAWVEDYLDGLEADATAGESSISLDELEASLLDG